VAIHSAVLFRIGKNSNNNSNKNSIDVRTFSKGLDLRFHAFEQYDTATTPINVISEVEEDSFGFKLSQLPNYSFLSNVYEQVRVDYVKLKIFNPGSSRSTQQPLRTVLILYAYDSDGGIEDTKNIFDRSNLELHPLSSSKPMCTLSGVPGTVSASDVVLKKRFFDAQSVGDNKFNLGHICCACDGFDQDPSTAKLNLIGVLSVTCSFKGKK
jgi:hypothetical protein